MKGEEILFHGSLTHTDRQLNGTPGEGKEEEEGVADTWEEICWQWRW